MKSDTERLMDVLGHGFRDPSLLENALTHSSYHNEHPHMPSNERLEFLGDAVLGFVISDVLHDMHPDLDEGHLTAKKARIVGGTHLAIVAERIGLTNHLMLGHGERREDCVKPSILADALEAVIAAVYLDGGIGAARKVILDLLGRAVEGREEDLPRDFKSDLQARALSDRGCLPRYRLVEASGPDHDKRFVFEVGVPGGPHATGRGHSKKSAQQAAARELIRVLERGEGADGGQEG